MADPNDNSQRQPYVSPQLTVVGSVRVVTQTGANTAGNTDSGMGGMEKTR